ncbi:serine/threonine-protein kinase [Nonomuraea sp. NEAU-A123]|uniref:serine/threonine-protein kinase n=1 Tax=Nonomuraea sp. NEAU-A123 TaxID=2839649 RepID=UPI001BE4321E|nr:serine/threonine-protein kinase [Nonomuraea sp. NEAU-A123]MBT2230496.1 serine/threonine protein kinase [Nonomuraea sp. NEAU-A123]
MRVIAGRYQLLAPLGAGGAGTVWRARDELLHREVAVKEVRLPPGQDQQRALVDTLREARAAAALNHPSIITVHDVISEGGQPWIIMDLLAGRSLGDLVKERGPLPPGHVATIGLRVLDALEAAHHRGILHRDVKPGNVMITDLGEVVLTDFGIAAHTDDVPGAGTAAAAAHAGGVAGSPGYIAPEHLRGEPSGPMADLWSLGATLYLAAEGRAPFERDSAMAIVAAVLTMPPPPPVNAGPLGGLLMAMLDRNPATRPHPRTIRAHLESLAVPLPVRPRETAPATVPVRARPRRRTPYMLGGLAAGTAVAVTAVILLNGSGGTGGSGGSPAVTTPATQIAQPASTAAPSPTTTTAPPTNPARGDGAFGRPPKACSLLTAEQAQRVLPGSHSRQRGVYDDSECSWSVGLSGFLDTTSINLKVKHSSEVKAAERAFTQAVQARDTEAGSEQTVTTSRIRTVSAGDEAAAQDKEAGITHSSTTTIWMRISNVIIQVAVSHPKRTKVTPQLRDTALKTARAVADTLQKAQ